MTSCARNLILFLTLGLLTGCSSGFLGLGPLGDRKEYVQARSAYETGNYQAALSHLRRYIYKADNVKRREARAYRLLGQSYERLNQPERALEVYTEALEFHPKNVPLLIAAGQLYHRSKLTDRSIEMFERALQEDAHNTQALAGQAINYSTLGFYSKARQFYDQFFALSEQISPKYRALYADTFLHQSNYEQAIIHITLALEEENTNADFWFLSAQAKRGLQKRQAALADLEAALLLAPERTDLWAQKALWLYEEGNYTGSLQIADKILAKQPGNTLAQLIQALNWRKQGKTKMAQKKLKQLAEQLRTEPNSFVFQVASQLVKEP